MRTHMRADWAGLASDPEHDADAPVRPVTVRGPEPTCVAAYELLIECQLTTGHDASHAARLLADSSRRAGRLDVCALATYATVVGHRLHEPQRPSTWTDIEHFVRWADASGDPLAISLARTARAGTGIYLNRRENPLDDLIGAYMAAERVEARVERGFALHEIAVNFHEMHMWDLSAELFDTVAEQIADLRTPRAVAGALAHNRYYTLAGELLHAIESGDDARVEACRHRVEALPARAANPAIPIEWRAEVEAYHAICTAVLRRDTASADRIADLLTDRPAAERVSQAAGLLRCVLAWHHIEHGRWDDAEALVHEGCELILSRPAPAFRSFALWLRARLRNRSTCAADLQALSDYRHALLREAEHSRQALSQSAQARLQTERLRVERDRFAYESQTDSLTGIANRRALEARLRTQTAPATLIIVDIDRFKPVNDRFGHEIGDNVLRRIGQILRDCVRPGDLAARLGGDEFVLVLETADAEVAVRRGHEVRDRIRSEPWHDLDPELRVAASVGVACGQAGERELYRAADEALYEAKRAGGGRVRALLPQVIHPATGTEA